MEDTAIERAGRMVESATMLAMLQSLIEVIVEEESSETDLALKMIFAHPVCGEA